MKLVVAFMVLVAVAGAQAQSRKGVVFENLSISNVTKAPASVAVPKKKK